MDVPTPEKAPRHPPAPELPDLEEGFWERTQQTETTRRGLFWLLLGVIAAILFFRNGVPDLFTLQ